MSTETGTRVPAFLAVLAILAASLTVIQSPPVNASSCGSDYWATDDWNQNTWISWSCDRNGEYTQGVQAILWYYPGPNLDYPCDPNGVDGYYGSNTAGAIRCYQDDMGLTIDGAVGTQTWPYLQDEIQLNDTSTNWEWWEIPDLYGAEYFALYTVNDDWYVRQLCMTSGQYVPFWENGPNRTQC